MLDVRKALTFYILWTASFRSTPRLIVCYDTLAKRSPVSSQCFSCWMVSTMYFIVLPVGQASIGRSSRLNQRGLSPLELLSIEEFPFMRHTGQWYGLSHILLFIMADRTFGTSPLQILEEQCFWFLWRDILPASKWVYYSPICVIHRGHKEVWVTYL